MDSTGLRGASWDAIGRRLITRISWRDEGESGQPDQPPTVPQEVSDDHIVVRYLYTQTAHLYISEQLYRASGDGLRTEHLVAAVVDRIVERAFRLFVSELLRRTGPHDYLYLLICSAQTAVNEELHGRFEAAHPGEWIEELRFRRPL